MTHQPQHTRRQPTRLNPTARLAPTGRHFAGALLLIAAFVFGACAAPATDAAPAPVEAMPATDAAPTEQATAQPSGEDMAKADDASGTDAQETMADGSDAGQDAMAADANADASTTASAMQDVPAWQTIALTNAVTGEQFTVADFAGKTIFVEPFATWCSNCRRQLGTVDSLRGESGDDTVFLALSVESNIGNEALASYASQTGYGLIFAAMPPEMLQLLVAEYGQTITNPPATPHFVVGPDGTSSELFTGFRSSAEIQELFAAVGG